ncbi:hypothetical protein JCM11491_006162 [Sporobolomyces phaffii]
MAKTRTSVNARETVPVRTPPKLRSSTSVRPKSTNPVGPTPLYRKAADKLFTKRLGPKKDTDRLASIATEDLPRDIVCLLSRELVERYIEERGCSSDSTSETGCLFKASKEPNRKVRPTVNLGNTTLREDNLAPEYRFLACETLSFAKLAQYINSRGAHKITTRPKLARLAYALSCERPTPELLRERDVSHLCGNAACFSPDHVVLETHKKNMSRERCFKPKGTRSECPHSIPCLLGEEQPGTEDPFLPETPPPATCTTLSSVLVASSESPFHVHLDPNGPIWVTLPVKETPAGRPTKDDSRAKDEVRTFLSFWDPYRA